MAWPIVGHDWAVALLRHSVAASRVAHAYMFSGPPQIGKTRLALTLAQALNCMLSEQDAPPPCGSCRSCLKIEGNSHPDVHLVLGEGAGGSIKIEQVRALQREAVLRPYEGRYRVFILRQADRATMEAADSLLKTLEEPPAHVFLVLTAVHVEALPSTVISRCQRLDLRPATCQMVEAALRERGMPPPKAQLLARLSGGRMGWALCASEDDTLLQQREQDLDRLTRLLSGTRVERLDFAWKASRDPVGARQLIELWTGWWRDLLLLCGRLPDHIVNIDRFDELQALASQSDRTQAWAALRALQTAAAQLQANVNTRLALESLLLKLPCWRPMAAKQTQ
jgi:DNA polymerase-3 subunit delta'